LSQTHRRFIADQTPRAGQNPRGRWAAGVTIQDENGNTTSQLGKPRRRVSANAFLVAILILAALLVIQLTLPLLGSSTVVFFVVAGVCWAAIFAGTFAVTRSLGRRDRKSD